MSGFSLDSIIQAAHQRVLQEFDAAVHRVAGRIQQRMEEIRQDMLTEYYGGYSPIMYSRTGQLNNAISSIVEASASGDTATIRLGLEADASAMDHSLLTIIVSNPKMGRFGFTINKDDVNEEMILENFFKGEHPNVGTAGTPPGVKERAIRRIKVFIQYELGQIIAAEMAKI